AALLLRSASGQHPNGLGNSSGAVGRFYMAHNNSAFMALWLRPNPTKFQKTLGLNEFYFGANDYEFPLGHIQMLGKTDAAMLKGETHGLVPNMALEEMARRSLDFWLMSEDLPLAQNRVSVQHDGIHIDYTPTNLEAHARLGAKLKDLLRHLRCE